MKVYDYECHRCGYEELDVCVENSDEKVFCITCDTPMSRKFPAPNVKTTPRHHHSLKGYKPGKPDVQFGSIKQGWYAIGGTGKKKNNNRLCNTSNRNKYTQTTKRKTEPTKNRNP